MKIKKLELTEIIKEEINKFITEDDFDDYMQSITTTSKAAQRTQGAANKATAPMRATRQFLINECGNQKILRAMFGHENERDIDFNLAEKDWPEYGPVSEQAEDFYFAVSNLVTDWVGDDEYDGRYNPNTTFQYLAPTRARSSYGSMIVNSDGNGPLLVKCKLTIDKYIGLNPDSGLKPLEERQPNLYTEGIAKMKIRRSQLEDIIKEEVSAMVEEFGDDSPFRMRDMVPPKVRGKFKDTFTKIPHPGRAHLMGKERRPNAQEKAAWKAAGGYLSVFDKPAIAQFLEDAGLYDPEFGTSSLEKYMDNVKYAIKGDRLGRQINSLVDALALANKTGSRRGHLKTAKKKSNKPPQFTRESIERITKEELSSVLHERSKSFTYKVIEDEFDGGPKVEVEGIDKTFEQMIEELEGKTLDFGDEPPFKFSIDLFDGEPWKMIVNGQAPAYIEMWAEMNGFEAEETGKAYY